MVLTHGTVEWKTTAVVVVDNVELASLNCSHGDQMTTVAYFFSGLATGFAFFNFSFHESYHVYYCNTAISSTEIGIDKHIKV